MLENIFTYDVDTKETTGNYTKYTPDTIIDQECSTLIECLPAKDGYTQIFDGEKWNYVVDHRGKMQYNTETREESEIKYFGEVLGVHTLLKPKSEFYNWNSVLKKWVEDKDAKETASKETTLNEAKAKYARLMQVVNAELLPLNDAADLLIISEPEIERRKKLQAYRVYLSRVPQQKDYPDVIEWPEYPPCPKKN